MRKLLLVSFIGLTLISCSLINRISSSEADNVEVVLDDDAEMNAAMQAAQDTLPIFISTLKSPAPGQVDFTVKVAFPYNDGTSFEHMWLSNVSLNGDLIEGTLENDPVYVGNIQSGDRVTVEQSDITDWIIIDDGRLLGGYTVHVLRNRMSDAERQQFDQDLGLIIGDQPELP